MQNQNQNQKQTKNHSQQQKKSIWTPVVHFAAHTFVGSLLFVIVGAPAVGLSMLVHALEAAHLDGFTVEVLAFLEHAILLADAGLFMTYLVVTAIKSVKEMWK
jgi:hypothetical protein